MIEGAAEIDGQRVAIIGMGPVGLTLAVDLARQGVRSLLVDSKAELNWTSRAACISRRSQEILQRIGIVPKFFETALGWNRGRTFRRDRQVFELEMPYDPLRDAHAPFINLQQFYTERFLLETARQMPDFIELSWSTSFVDFEDLGDGVLVRLRNEDGTEFSHRCGYLVGCDGARSPVRAAAGLKLKGQSYEGRYLIADIRMDEAVERPVERWVWFDPDSNRGSTAIFHVQPDRVWRVDVQADEADSDEALLAQENVRRVVQSHLDMMGVKGSWELIWHSLYKANALTLDTYRSGRTFLAGDAAHLVPIFGVRGMNSGIDDAHNLAWKLALAIRGNAGPDLLDSYTGERRRAALENLGNAVRSTWFMSPPSDGFRVMRDGALLLAQEHAWVRPLVNPRQSTAHVYATSRCVTGDVEAGSALPAGSVLPNVPLSDGGGFLHDLLAPVGAFTLLVNGSLLGSAQVADLQAREWAAPLAVRLLGPGHGAMISATDLALLFSDTRGAFILVRPDEHIVGWARNLAACEGLMDTALGKSAGCGDEPFIEVPDAGQLVPPTPLEVLFQELARDIDAGRASARDAQDAARLLKERYSPRA